MMMGEIEKKVKEQIEIKNKTNTNKKINDQI
jgi:hypothetical protein